MAHKIQKLSKQAINQIAAGEVIENPASVVKELIENSLDAGATQIEITLLEGGQGRVRVKDNGHGIAKDQASLALEPHATSKLRDPKDLANISTMGFRGEALASIASISRFFLETSQGGEGISLFAEGGQLLKRDPLAREAGTQVTVDDLFFNAPVRRAFQKGAASDGAQVRKVVNLLALAHPEVGFILKQGEDLLLKAPPLTFPFQEAFEERVELILGKEFGQEGIGVDYKEGKVGVKGVIGNPTFTRPSRIGQTLFLNRRAITSSLVSQAVLESFSTRLSKGRYPVFALHIEMPPDHVDVNVHPQKREVRFREEEKIKQVIIRAVSEALAVNPLPLDPLPFESSVEEAFISDEAFGKSFIPFKQMPTSPEKPSHSIPIQSEIAPQSIHIFGLLSDILMIGPIGPYAKEEGILLLHTKRAKARIQFERLLSEIKGGSLSSQMLAIPAVIELLPDELDRFKRFKSTLERLGIEARPFGRGTVVIESLPSLLHNQDPKKVLERLLTTLRMEGAWEELAAKEAVKIAPNSPLTLDQATPFVREWLACDEPIRCPYGRAVCSMITLDAILRRF